ncbi:hypothetical protein Pan216_49400 [Planctomycetes bacterium Pan216]|uniref:Uncharacterized protein n=1 Tax=Kolteria novifilia TaxID=2527975 RepID=A0A518BAQ0_9BACT|nr:hypothetical protein Pan216_49400 [Planctomycetes bacterium Pan216]
MVVRDDQRLHELYKQLGEHQAAQGQTSEAADSYALALYFAHRTRRPDLVAYCRIQVAQLNPDHVLVREESAPLLNAQLLLRIPPQKAEGLLAKLKQQPLTTTPETTALPEPAPAALMAATASVQETSTSEQLAAATPVTGIEPTPAAGGMPAAPEPASEPDDMMFQQIWQEYDQLLKVNDAPEPVGAPFTPTTLEETSVMENLAESSATTATTPPQQETATTWTTHEINTLTASSSVSTASMSEYTTGAVAYHHAFPFPTTPAEAVIPDEPAPRPEPAKLSKGGTWVNVFAGLSFAFGLAVVPVLVLDVQKHIIPTLSSNQATAAPVDEALTTPPVVSAETSLPPVEDMTNRLESSPTLRFGSNPNPDAISR